MSHHTTKRPGGRHVNRPGVSKNTDTPKETTKPQADTPQATKPKVNDDQN